MNQVKERNIIVSVVVPVRNEEKYIHACMKSILSQDYPKENIEINLVDGVSDDTTVSIIEKYMEKHGNINLIENKNKTVQYALNLGIENSKGIYIVRFDAHAEYASNYISKCIEYIEKTNADNVGGPTIAKGKSRMQKIIAAAYHSTFALGGGLYHQPDYEGYADTVFPGVYKKSKLQELGLYDENFPRNEDDELNLRLIKSGGKIYITPEIKCIYYPRNNLIKLFTQYFEYGLWKVAVIKKHKNPARISHLVPITFVLFMLIFGIGSFYVEIIKRIFLEVMLIYLCVNLYFSFKSKYINGIYNKLALCVTNFILHTAYGTGFLCGIVKFYNKSFKERRKVCTNLQMKN